MTQEDFILDVRESYGRTLEVLPSKKYPTKKHCHILFQPGEQFDDFGILIDLIHGYGIYVVEYGLVAPDCHYAEIFLTN